MKQKLNLRFLMTLVIGVFVSVSAFAQDILVKGHVKDDIGEDVIGASVRVKGTQQGAVTDVNGNFSIKVEKGAKLIISFIGFQSQEVSAAQNMSITLHEDLKLLNETVIIGYGAVKKTDLTGSVVAIKPDEMSKGITTNMQDMLSGKIAGVSVISDGGDPSASSSIRIRGGASLSASNDPLIVIDGIQMDNNGVQGLGNPLSMVNPEDIETLTVLKDASSCAIYGSRGSNGVIIITTKKGRAGAKPKITYTGNVSFATVRKTYDVLSGDEYRAYAQTLVDNGTLSQDAYNKLGTANTDWQDEIYRTGVSTDHSLGIAGALKHMPYRVSLGYTNKNGIAKNSGFERFTGSVNLNPSLLDDHLVLNFSAKYMHGKNRWADYGIFGGAINADPTQPVHDTANETTGGYWQPYLSNAAKNISDWNAPVTNKNCPQNVVALLDFFDRKAKSNVFIGSLDAEYKIHGFEDLSIHANVSGDYSEGNDPTNISPYSYSNNYYGYTEVSKSYKYQLSGGAYLNYNHKFFDDSFDVNVMVGAEEQHFHRNTFKDGGGNWLGTTLVEDPANYYSPTTSKDTKHIRVNTLVSRFGRINLNYLDRYLLTGTWRNDNSSFFSPDNRSANFFSGAFAWKINNEPFLRDVEALSDLKLRIGYGQTGQQAVPDELNHYYAPQYVIGNPYAMYNNQTTVRPTVYNPNLKWETTTTFNVGLDFGFLSGRFDGSIEFYNRKTTDLLAHVSIGPMVNFGNYMYTNFGDLQNKGIEFNINAHPITSRDFSWTVNYNVSYNKNEITKLNLGGSIDYAMTGNSISAGLSNKVMVNKEGYAANSFYVYQQVYDENGKPIEGQFVDRNGDGKITGDDRYVYKHAPADVIMGMTNKFIYKKWDFSFTLRASLNNYVYYDFLSNKANVSASGLYTNGAFNNTTRDAVELGFSGKTDYYMSDYFVRNASFLRCDNITLGYSFDRLFETSNYRGVGGRVYFLVQNPFVITKYDGLDPEISASKSGNGIDSGLYPRPRTYMLGVSLNF